MPNTTLAIFQCNIAWRWLNRGDNSGDVFAKFFFYFAGFNALYFLWKEIDDVRNQEGNPAGEEKQIHHVIGMIETPTAKKILRQLTEPIKFFLDRGPIQRMDRRIDDCPSEGGKREGAKWHKRLMAEDPIEKLKALGSILYLIRSNLVHGSKAESGDDKEIINHAVAALRLIFREALSLTRTRLLPDG